MHGASWLLCGFGRWWGKVPDNFSFHNGNKIINKLLLFKSKDEQRTAARGWGAGAAG
jgi:hypothetical protein